MRTKQSFIPFNLLWCIASFFLPFALIPMVFPDLHLAGVFTASLFIYARSVLQQSYADWLEWRISLLESPEDTKNDFT